MRLQQLSIATLAFVFLCGSASIKAQQTEANDTTEATANEMREKAFDLLESLASQLSLLQSPENRARLGANIADSLWTHDEQRARLLFRTVSDDIRLGLQYRDFDDPRDQQTQLVFLKLRLDTVERIAKRDPELAMEFLKATEPVFIKPPPRQFLEQAQRFELHLANQLAASNPELTLKLARQALDKGFSQDLLQVLRDFLYKDRQRGSELYREVITKLRSTNLSTDWIGVDFAASLATYPQPPDVDPQLFRDLMNVLINSTQASACGRGNSRFENSYLCNRFEYLVRQMEQVDRNPAGRVNQRQSYGYSGYGPNREVIAELDTVIAERNIDKVLALINKFPQAEQLIYSRAFALAEELDDIDRAKKLASEFKGDPQTRQQMLMRLKRRADLAAFGESQFAETQRKLQQLESPWQRIDYLLELAASLYPYNRTAALKLLGQANSMTETSKPGYKQLEAFITLAGVYSILKSERGLAIMESLMPRLNELVDAAAKLDGVETNYLRDGEWNMSGEGRLGSMLTRLARYAPLFAWSDFDRAVRLASQFERTEIRMMAQVKLAQGLISGPPPTSRR